jgi:selenophosphate synthetase-related protein
MTSDSLLKKYRQLKDSHDRISFPVKSVRDLLVTEITKDLWMVVSSDSDGGIGPKKYDSVFSHPYDLGRLAARVPLIEMIASGSIPLLVVDVLAVEMEPTGAEIIRGVKDEAEEAGLNSNTVVTGSTEDNVVTVQTGMGVVVIGIVSNYDFRPGKSNIGDIIVSIGIPKSAPEYKVVYNDPEIVNTKTIRQLNQLSFIHDILPVGSKGIKHEFIEIGNSAGLSPRYFDVTEIDVTKSGGPSTCCLVSIDKKDLTKLTNLIDKPICVIGELRGQLD